MTTAIDRLWRTSRPLTAVGLLMVAVGIASAIGVIVDPRIITGARAWLKPLKFAISTAVYSLTLAWVFGYLIDWPRMRRVVGWTTAIVFGLCVYYMVGSDLAVAQSLAAQCLTVARKARDDDFLLEGCCVAGPVELYRGRLVAARAIFERGLAIYRPDRHRDHAARYGQDPLVALAFVARVHAMLGRPDLARQRGRVINVVSVGAAVGLPRLAAYCAAKAGVEALTRVLALEWAERQVTVNAIGPAFVATDMTARLRANPHLREGLVQRTPLGRLGEVEDVVGAAIYLASDAARYVTGQTLYVDGGWLAQ